MLKHMWSGPSQLFLRHEAAKIRPMAADHWLGKLDEINTENFRAILAEVPDSEISGPARDFALRMMEINAHRLLQAR